MTGFSSASTIKRGGRPKGSLGPKARSIREAVLGLTVEYDVMTVRQVFYQLVSRGIVPKSENGGYRPVQDQVLKMRREGWLPWWFIADGTRWMRKPKTYSSAQDAIREMHRTYRRNLWASQDVRIEVWLEKDALAGVVNEVTEAWDVPLMVSRGMASATFLYNAGQAIRNAWEDEDAETYIYCLYDFDAAGRRAARNIESGLLEHAGDAEVHFELLAVTDAQIVEWDLPTRPAKPTDPEAHKFGPDAVELDAIPPDNLTALVEDAITSHIDKDAWEKEKLSEGSERAFLDLMGRRLGVKVA
jgi:hypothetical protein